MSHKCDLLMMRGLAVAACCSRAATMEVDTSGNPQAIVAISGKLELGDEDALRTKTANLSRGGSQVTSAYIQLAALIHGEAVELTSDDDEGGDSSEVEKAVGETEELEDEFEARNESASAVILSLVGYSNSNASMVKPTQDWQGEHASYPLGVARNRRVLFQR
jgi:hypothetical protein